MTTALACLAFALYFEARSEPVLGQYAVAEVIMNRVEDPRFPDSVCGVVTQDLGPKPWDCQFSFWCDGKPEVIHNPLAYDMAYMIARDILEVPDTPLYTDGALYYHTVDVSPGWSREMPVALQAGRHLFFLDPVILANM